MKVSIATRMVKMKKKKKKTHTHKNTKYCREKPLEYTLLTDGTQSGASLWMLAAPSTAAHTHTSQLAAPPLECHVPTDKCLKTALEMAHMPTSSRNKTHFVVPSQVIKKKKAWRRSHAHRNATV